MKAKTSFSLKDQLINPETCELVIQPICKTHAKINETAFRKDILSKLPSLELKECLLHITHTLKNHLPQEYSKAIDIILKSLPKELDPTLKDDDFGEFIYAPYSLFVANYGCEKKHLKRSLNALKDITKRFSAEEAIRTFINAYPKETFQFLKTCCKDKNYHVRRWASEGTRPKLPWAQNITSPIKAPLPFLDHLYRDTTRYVTRSVANHLNDISKINPELVLEKLQSWKSEGKQDRKEMDYISKHACRTLIKQGHSGALNLLGFPTPPKIDLQQFSTTKNKVKMGQALEFSLTLQSKATQNLMIDYVVENIDKKNSKVFKLKQLNMKKGETTELKKSHPFKLMTTRSLYPGPHRLSLQINGKAYPPIDFELTT